MHAAFQPSSCSSNRGTSHAATLLCCLAVALSPGLAAATSPQLALPPYHPNATTRFSHPHTHPQLRLLQGLLEIVHELLERLEAHLTANAYYSVIANMRGDSALEVSERLLQDPELAGLSVSGRGGNERVPAMHLGLTCSGNCSGERGGGGKEWGCVGSLQCGR